MRLGAAGGEAPDDGGGREQRRRRQRGAAIVAGQVELRQPVGDGDADLGAGLMQLRLRGADVGALLRQPRRQADRQAGGQVQGGERQGGAAVLVRKAAGQRQQQMPLLRQLLLQRRQGGLRLRQLGFLRQHVGLGDAAEVELLLNETELIGFRLDDLLRGLDLAAQRDLLDRGRHHVRGQRQVGGLELEALILGLRGAAFDQPPLAAEHVGRIGDIHGRLEEIENARRAGPAEGRGRELLAGGRAVGIDIGQQHAGLGVEILLRLPQRRLRGLQARIGRDGGAHQRHRAGANERPSTIRPECRGP